MTILLAAVLAGFAPQDDDTKELFEFQQRFRAVIQQVKRAYVRTYVRSDGRIRPSTQGAYVLALAFDMVPPELAPKLAAHLAKLVRKNDHHLSTGFPSTVHLCPVLCRYGYEDLAFALLNQDTAPSWLYQVKQGASTIWEEWDAKRPDGSLHKGTSFNHYAFGAVGDWLYNCFLDCKAFWKASHIVFRTFL